jgi:hypothetical protein
MERTVATHLPTIMFIARDARRSRRSTALDKRAMSAL